MVCKYLISALFLFSAGTVVQAQTCPTPANILSATNSASDRFTQTGITASAENRGRMASHTRANAILLWKYKGDESLKQARPALNLLASCISNGGCGFPQKDPQTATGIYEYINGKSVVLPAAFRAPPPVSVIAWANEKLGCVASPALLPSVTRVSLARRPVPVLIPETEEAKTQLESTQNSVRMIDEFCHGEPVSRRAENCLKLGKSFDRGIAGFKYDSDSAQYYYKQACIEGEPWGCNNYGGYLRQWGKTQAEKDTGTEYVGKACDLGLEMSCFNYKAWTGKVRGGKAE